MENLDTFVIGSPGFTKDGFMDFIKAEGDKRNNRKLSNFISEKVVTVHTSSGHKHSLMESEELQHILGEHSVQHERKILESFIYHAQEKEGWAAYGFRCIKKLIDNNSIDVISDLLVTDKLYRAFDPDVRKKYVSLIDRVKRGGAKIHHLSSGNDPG